MIFTFASSPRIISGPGCLDQLPDEIKRYGIRTLLVTGKSSLFGSRAGDKLSGLLKKNRIIWDHYIVPGEPSPELIDRCVENFKDTDPQVIVAIGGGSVLDAGKAISAMWRMNGTVKNYLEGVGDRQHDGSKVPFIAVPTTAGTGSEATKNAVISEVGKNGYKKSLRHNNFIPDLALVDPELTLSCPKNTTAWSGMDAFTQLLESYVSTKSSPMTDSLALSGLQFVSRDLEKAVENGNDQEARNGMSYAALCSGITLANTGLGVIHGFASSIGGRFDIPHGLICGSLMGISNRLTLDRLVEGGNWPGTIKKYARVGKMFGGPENKNDLYYARMLIDKISDMIQKFGFPGFGKFGIDHKAVDDIVKKTSCKNNPVALTTEELSNILVSRI